MGSFDLSYDADEDVLEVTFTLFDDHFARTVALNDHIFVFTDPGTQAVWGLTFYSYSRLLGVSETEFTSLRELPPEQAQAFLALLAVPPASYFFDLTDPEGLIARVRAPGLGRLVEESYPDIFEP